jgi:heptosyltransferase-2
MKTSTPERLVIIAPNWLGDAVMSLPLINDIHREWTETHLSVAARTAVAPVYEMAAAVDEVIVLKGGGGLGGIRAVGANASMLAGFDAALLLPNSFASAWTVARAGIKERWGFRADLRGPLLTRAIARPPKLVHQAEYYQALAAMLGIPEGERTARLTVPNDARARAGTLLARAGVVEKEPIVVMAPGAAYGSAKQWLPHRFAELARLLRDQRGLRSVLVGARADAKVCREIAAASGAVDLAAQTDLQTLAGVLAAAQVVVTNDSGAMHLAAAVGTRVIAIFGATNEKKSAPLGAGFDAPTPTIVATNVWCRPCMLRECPIDHRCMTRIDARTVFDAVVSDSASFQKES